METFKIKYDQLIFAVGKSGIDFSQKIIKEYNLPTEPKSVQIGVRFEAPQKYFQKLIDISYDFKLYKKYDNVSLRTFCLPGNEIIHIERNNNRIFTSIDDVKKEDKILTFNFEIEKTEFINPKSIFNREYKGNLITINNKITTTEDHLFFIWEKELILDEYNRKDGYKDDSFKLNKIIEKQAKDLKIGDRLVIPKTFPKLNKNRYTNYDNNQLWMFGLWFADGSGQYNSKWNSNGFNLTNKDYILDKVIEILKNQNENYSSKKDYDNYSVLNFSSKILKEFLINELCFKKGKERGLPKSIFNWSEEEIYSFLSGLFDGDGRIKKEYNISLDYFTVSDILYRDLTYLFNYLGINYKSRTREQATNFKEDSKINIININKRDSVFLLSLKLNLVNKEKNKLLKENIEIKFENRDIKNYEKIYSINCEYFEGQVYDFEIDNTHNFIVGNTPIIVHNCTNNNAAYVAVEETYGDISYNGHAKKGKEFENGMTNFGILMEIKGIENPFEWSREVVQKCQRYFVKNLVEVEKNEGWDGKSGLYYSPSNRTPSLTSEDEIVKAVIFKDLDNFKEAFGKYADYIIEFIEDMKKVFPKLKDDWGIYIPEVKYLSPEPLVNYNNLSLKDYNNVYFIGDALSARGITVSGAQGIYTAEYLLQ